MDKKRKTTLWLVAQSIEPLPALDRPLHRLWPGSGHPDGGTGLAAGHPAARFHHRGHHAGAIHSLFIALLLVTLGKAVLAYGREVASFKAGSAVRQAIRELVLTRL